MRKLATLMFFGFFVIFGVGASTGTAQAQPGVYTFNFTNKAPFIIYVRMFSQSRNAVWPTGGHFILRDGAKHSARLNCLVGERICYGAAYSTDGKGRYWGAGYNGNEACTGCCVRCGTTQQNLSNSWNLLE